MLKQCASARIGSGSRRSIANASTSGAAVEEVQRRRAARLGDDVAPEDDLVAPPDGDAESSSTFVRHRFELRIRNSEQRRSRVSQEPVVRELEREDVVGQQGRAARHEVSRDRCLPCSRRGREGDRAPVEHDRARMEQLHALERRRERQDLRKEKPLPDPRRELWQGGNDVPAVERDEVAAHAKRPDPVAETRVVIDRHSNAARGPQSVEDARCLVRPPAPLESCHGGRLDDRSSGVAARGRSLDEFEGDPGFQLDPEHLAADCPRRQR